MPVTLVQTSAHGFAAATFTATHQTITATCSLASITPGNFLCTTQNILVEGGTVSVPQAAVITVVGTAMTFVSAEGSQWQTTTAAAITTIEYLTFANTLTSGSFVLRANNSTTGGTSTLSAEFLVLEFAGVENTREAISLNLGTASVPTSGSLINTVSTLVLSTFSSDPPTGSNISPGTGFTMAATMTGATFSQLQYASVAAGTSSADFSGAAQGRWGCGAASFRLATSTVAAITAISQPILLGF